MRVCRMFQCWSVNCVKGRLQINKGNIDLVVPAVHSKPLDEELKCRDVIVGGVGGHKISLLRVASRSDGEEGMVKENTGEVFD